MKRILFLIFCLATFFVNNGVLRPDIMEVRNLVAAHEMVTDGHWLVPTMNGDWRLEKPPLPTWVAAGVEMVCGDSLCAQRCAAGVMALLLAYFLFLLAKFLSGRTDTAITSTLVLMTCYTIVLQGRTATWDIYCHAFMLGAVYFLAVLWKRQSDRPTSLLEQAAPWAATLLMGLSFMSKGPVAFFAMLLPAAIALLSWQRPQMRGRWAGVALMVLGVLVLSAWWYVYIYAAVPEATRFVVHKESASWVNHNVRPWWYYWRFFLEAGIWAPMVLFVLYKSLRHWRQESATTRIAVVWTLAGVVLLSLFPEKKMRYLMPLMVPISLMIADWVCRHWSRRTVTRLMAVVCGLFCVLEVAALPFLRNIFGYEARHSLTELRPAASVPDVNVYYVEAQGRDFRIDMVYFLRHRIEAVSEAKLDSVLALRGRKILLVSADSLPEALQRLQPCCRRDMGVYDDNPYARSNKHYNRGLINRAVAVHLPRAAVVPPSSDRDPLWAIFLLGFISQLIFGARMLAQWVLSEKQKRVVTPTSYWVMSLVGSLLMLMYGLFRHDFSILLGQTLTYYIYIWNIHLKGHWQRLHLLLRWLLMLMPLIVGVLLAGDARSFLDGLFRNEDIPLWLLLVGSLGQTVFSLRFVYQWIWSYRHGVSSLPLGFWVISLLGSSLIVVYALIRLDPVLIMSQSFGYVAYVRNLMLSLRERREARKCTD